MRIIFLLALLCPCFSNCQPLPLSGQVINTEMQPIAGATVVLKRTGTTVITTTDGRFSFPAALPADTIVVSAVGYKTASIPNNQRGLHTVILEVKNAEMETVVINTGYQRLPKERITGSFTYLDNKALNRQPGYNILDRLEGISNGILFDRNPNRPAITVRGLSTINGPRSPLVILDNFPFEGDINTINPNDIESITILKDAAAASIWGTRAGNGVIVLTTKKGNINQPLSVSFNSFITRQAPPDLSYLKPIASSDFIALEQYLFSKGFYNSQEANKNRPVLSPAVELLIRNRNGQLSDADLQTELQQLAQFDVRNDYQDYVYRPAWNSSYALQLQGGSPSAAYSFSSAFDRNNSDLNANLSRITLRSQNTMRISKKLQLQSALSYVTTFSRSGMAPYGSIFLNSTQRLYPYARIADDEGNPLPLYMYRQPYTDTAGAGKLLDWKFYPLEDYKHNTSVSTLNSFIGNAAIRYNFFRQFALDLRYQYEKQQVSNDNFRSPLSFYTRDLINRFSQLNRSTGVITHIVPNAGILDNDVTNLEAHNLRGQVSFESRVGKTHLSAIAGNEWRHSVNTASSGRFYGYSDDIISITSMDYVNRYPTFISGSNQAIPDNQSLSEKTYRFISFYANAACTYNEKYTLTASGRKDASNMFGINTNDKWNPLWSAGLSWHLSRETFYKSSLLPEITVRATYGYSGNVDPSKSAVTTIRYGSAAITGYPSANFNQYSNPELRWEKVRMLNIGIDFASKGRITSGSLEYYAKRGIDLFGPAPLDFTTGLNLRTITRNIASMKGRGIDVVLNTVNLRKSVEWSTSILFNYNTSTITDYYLSATNGSSFVSAGSAVSGVSGRPVYAIMSYQWAGLDSSGNPRGVVEKSITTDYAAITGAKTQLEDLVFSGSAIPEFFGSISNTFVWKRLSLSVLLSYKLGHSFRKESIVYGQLFSQNLGHADYTRRWQKPGDENVTFVPALIYPNNSNRDQFYSNSEVLVTSGSHIRLHLVNFDYTIINPKDNAHLKSLRLYTALSNAGIIWRANKDGIDPDYGSNMPPSPSLTIGVKAVF